MPVTSVLTDIRVASRPVDVLDMLPDAEGLQQSSDAFKEITAYLVFWLRGDV